MNCFNWNELGGMGEASAPIATPLPFPTSSLVELLNKRSPKQCHTFDNGSAHFLFWEIHSSNQTFAVYVKLLYSDVNCENNKLATIISSFKFAFAQFTSSSLFHSIHGLRWTQQISLLPINVWVFIAQLVEHCSANTEAMSSNPNEVLKIFFFSLICNCLNCNYHCDDHTFIWNPIQLLW